MDINLKNRCFAGIYGGMVILIAYFISWLIPIEYCILWVVAMIWFFVSLKK